jgi:hypothetical protein
MIEIIVVIVGAILFWNLVARGFRLGERTTAASEATTELLLASVRPEVREQFIAKRKAEADTRRTQKLVLGIILGVIAVIYFSTRGPATPTPTPTPPITYTWPAPVPPSGTQCLRIDGTPEPCESRR